MGVRDKVLAEFIIELAKNSQDQNQFIKNLNDADAEFPLTLIEKLFSIIKKMLPKTKNIQTEETIKQQE